MYTLGCQIFNPPIYVFQTLMKMISMSVFIIPHHLAAMAAYITGQVMYAGQLPIPLYMFFLSCEQYLIQREHDVSTVSTCTIYDLPGFLTT